MGVLLLEWGKSGINRDQNWIGSMFLLMHLFMFEFCTFVSL